MKKTITTIKSSSTSVRFVDAILKEFRSQIGEMRFSEDQMKLAQHLFIKINAVLEKLENDRIEKNINKPPIIWSNIDIKKLAIDASHRIDLGLDALIENHIHIIPYYAKISKKYQLDLRIGYTGKIYYKSLFAKEKPKNIRIELVYETDKFKPLKKDNNNPIESYIFEITNPFDRGEIIGGFGYIIYNDSTHNKLILVSEKDFKKSESYAQTDAFWKPHPEKMRLKTIAHKTCDYIEIDPHKITTSYAFVEKQDNDFTNTQINEDENNLQEIDIHQSTKIDEYQHQDSNIKPAFNEQSEFNEQPETKSSKPMPDF